MRRPTCQGCGRPLQKETIAVFPEEGETIDDALARNGTDRSKVTKVVTDHSGHRALWVQFWTGQFGYMGNNRFCTKGCAYDWAVSRAPVTWQDL